VVGVGSWLVELLFIVLLMMSVVLLLICCLVVVLFTLLFLYFGLCASVFCYLDFVTLVWFCCMCYYLC